MSIPAVERNHHVADTTAPNGKTFPSPAIRQAFLQNKRTFQSAVRWTFLIAFCYLLGELGTLAGAPAPHLLAALLVGAVAALSGAVRSGFPRPATLASQAGVGVLMGSYARPDDLGTVGQSALPLLGVTIATIALCLVGGLVLSRAGRISVAAGTLGMVPGGSAAVVAAAEELRADGRLVAFTQYLRVALVALTAPVVAFALHPASHLVSGNDPASINASELHHFVQGPHQFAGLLVLVVVCVLGVQAGRRLALPAATLLGPMLLAALFLFTGAADGFAPDGALKGVLFAGVGLEVGLRFTRQSVRHIGRLLPHVLIGTLVVCLACAGLAWVLATVIHMPVMDAYLATTPGGINAVLAAAASTNSNIPVVSTVQSARLFIVMLITPPIVRWLATVLRQRHAPEQAEATPRKPA